MKLFIFLIVFVATCFYTQKLHAQSGSGQLYFIRATGYVASAVNFRLYIDGSLRCKLKNKTYSVHTLPAGKHTVFAQNSGLGSRKRSKPFDVTIEQGKITYVDVIWANDVSCEEITSSSAEKKLKGLKQTTACNTKE
ncbi:DUF2846 domain-containing protein [Chitinophaga pinensis]|uniref:DUF2846 domain-containing protein n=1 Tax=Chitinophaga pinensis (strain ATCC 43595 / DSM 2588 / LMG 13176 / NBRC 15968 / NCIMB 11800 / UQM 2034) TaxID=485918 RepID=A0A979G2E1_CHIPD|nr:DUF2846 domain-containing protein [Chitinophaga pinensis]ACU59549.1 hypothetical protein Cpin_2054 [Chitinophaga pinensis DSM 2588]